MYIFIRNLFTRVLTILLTISHANSNDPSSSASFDWAAHYRSELTPRERHDYFHDRPPRESPTILEELRRVDDLECPSVESTRPLGSPLAVLALRIH